MKRDDNIAVAPQSEREAHSEAAQESYQAELIPYQTEQRKDGANLTLNDRTLTAGEARDLDK
jgi:hypothetical protein